MSSTNKNSIEVINLTIEKVLEDREDISTLIEMLKDESLARDAGEMPNGYEKLPQHDVAKPMVKYIEAKQRTNEQLIKLANILRKIEEEETALDVNSLYDDIQEQDEYILVEDEDNM